MIDKGYRININKKRLKERSNTILLKNTSSATPK